MRKSKETIEHWLTHGIDIPNKTVYLNGEVGDAMLDRATAAFQLFKADNQPVTVLLSTPGGSVTDGMAIYDQIQSCKAHVTVRVVGAAFSMGAVILQAGDHREAYASSLIMHHIGTDSYGGHSKNVELAAKFYKKVAHEIDRIMLGRVNERMDAQGKKLKTMKWWKEYDLFDRFYTTKTAIEAGFLDSIVTLKGK